MTNHKLKKQGKIHDTVTGYDFREDKMLGPLKTIHQRCLMHSGTAQEVARCETYDCPNWPRRSGKRGPGKRQWTPEQRKAIGERLRRGRENKKVA